jgi:hypothetical protein
LGVFITDPYSGTIKVKKLLKLLIIPTALLGISVQSGLFGQSQYHKEIPLSDESAVNVRLESTYGTVNIGGSARGKILVADMVVKPSLDMKTDITYRIENRTGLLDLILRPEERQKRSWGIGGPDAGTWDLKFNKDIPLNFDIELGAGRGTFDFSGMHLNRLNLSAGASSVTVRFNEPNPGFIDHMRIESGVSRFNGEKLGNANFGTLKFEGGVGSYTLDFNGILQHEAEVHVQLGIGAVTLIIPEHIGVKLYAEQRLFSSVNVPNDFERVSRNEYITGNFHDAQGKLIVRIESGFGSVRVTR